MVLVQRIVQAIEHNIFDKELRHIREQLEAIEDARAQAALNRDTTLDKSENDKATITKLTNELQQLERQRDKLISEGREIEIERKDHLSRRAKLELEVADAEAAIGDEKTATTKIQSELHRVKKEKAQKEAELKKVVPKLEAATAKKDGLMAEYHDAKSQQDNLFARQTRTTQFSTVAERNKFIDGEIKSLKALAKAKTAQIETTEAAVKQIEASIAKAKAEAQDDKVQNEERRKKFSELQAKLVEARNTQDKFQDERRDGWQKEAMLDSRKTELETEVAEAERVLFSTVAKHTTKGIEAIRRFQEEEGIEGIHGPLYDLITYERA